MEESYLAEKVNNLSMTGCRRNFTLVGEAVIKDGITTFAMDEKSGKANSDWIYNRLNLAVDCGEKCGMVYAEAMGGYGSERDNVIYVHGKDENGRDDFQERFTIAWEDRFDKETLKEIGDNCFYEAGFEIDKDGKVVFEHFLSEYDLIKYVRANLKNGDKIKVRGELEYQEYQNRVTSKKKIKSIYLVPDAEKEDFQASFLQTILLQKDNAGKLDKDTNSLPVQARVIEYFNNDVNGERVKGYYTLPVSFEYRMNTDKPELIKKIKETLFKVKRDVTKATFEGLFVEGGAVVETKLEDLPDDIQQYVSLNIMTEDEAIKKCAGNGNKIKKMILTKPYIRRVESEDGKGVTPVLMVEERAYKDEDMVPWFITAYKAEQENDDDGDDDYEEENDESVKMDDLDEDEELMKMLNQLD